MTLEAQNALARCVKNCVQHITCVELSDKILAERAQAASIAKVAAAVVATQQRFKRCRVIYEWQTHMGTLASRRKFLVIQGGQCLGSLSLH